MSWIKSFRQTILKRDYSKNGKKVYWVLQISATWFVRGDFNSPCSTLILWHWETYKSYCPYPVSVSLSLSLSLSHPHPHPHPCCLSWKHFFTTKRHPILPTHNPLSLIPTHNPLFHTMFIGILLHCVFLYSTPWHTYSLCFTYCLYILNSHYLPPYQPSYYLKLNHNMYLNHFCPHWIPEK